MGTEGLPAHRPEARRKSTQHRSMELRHWLAVLSFCVLGLGITVAYSTGLLATLFSQTAPSGSTSVASRSHAPLDTRWCKRLEFDNGNRRVFESNVPCDGEVLNENGVPVPVGTMHRLNAISKSFSRK